MWQVNDSLRIEILASGSIAHAPSLGCCCSQTRKSLALLSIEIFVLYLNDASLFENSAICGCNENSSA